jgi:dTDP-4-dehydrorhamnose 3,5-epimerase
VPPRRSARSIGASELSTISRHDAPSFDQDGSPLAPAIDGVLVQHLSANVDHRGSLTEVIDRSWPFWGEPIVYAYLFTIRPGRIKGWGMHERQTDRYAVLAGDVRVVLYDDRPRSATRGQFCQFYFTDTVRGLVRIPPGVWHADQNFGSHEAMVMNFPTRPYNRAKPDKRRLDPHSNAIPFDWALHDG